jgi:hypothetical protein
MDDRVIDENEVLVELWKGTGARITERRSYEWKIAFGLWTAQLLAIGFTLSNIGKVENRAAFGWLYLLAGLVLSGLHAYYVLGFIVPGNEYESSLARRYEADLHDKLDSVSKDTRRKFNDTPAERRREKRRQKCKKPSRVPYTSANWFAVAVTVFLALIGPLAVAFM